MEQVNEEVTDDNVSIKDEESVDSDVSIKDEESVDGDVSIKHEESVDGDVAMQDLEPFIDDESVKKEEEVSVKSEDFENGNKTETTHTNDGESSDDDESDDDDESGDGDFGAEQVLVGKKPINIKVEPRRNPGRQARRPTILDENEDDIAARLLNRDSSIPHIMNLSNGDIWYLRSSTLDAETENSNTPFVGRVILQMSITGSRSRIQSTLELCAMTSMTYFHISRYRLYGNKERLSELMILSTRGMRTVPTRYIKDQLRGGGGAIRFMQSISLVLWI
jgi:hypothetical protein